MAPDRRGLLGTWLVAGAAVDLWSRTGRGGIGHRLGRLTRLPRADWGKTIAHAGVGITMFGVVTLTGWQVEDIRVARKWGEPYRVGAYEIELVGRARERARPELHLHHGHHRGARGRKRAADRPNCTPNGGSTRWPGCQRPRRGSTTASPAMSMSRSAIRRPGGGWAVRTWIKPFANWIWGGTIIMALGGLFSLSDRRYRVAAGAGKSRSAAQGCAGGMRMKLARPDPPGAGMALPAAAVQPDEVLPDPVLEERARDISAGLRCIVCRNESIDESNAELARDLRLLVRERLVEGDSDDGGRGLYRRPLRRIRAAAPADDRLHHRAVARRAGADAAGPRPFGGLCPPPAPAPPRRWRRTCRRKRPRG
jgi:hypothetical protein